MLNLILIIIGAILLTVAIVWLIDKFVPAKAKPIITIALWALIIFLGYLTFDSVYGEIKFFAFAIAFVNCTCSILTRLWFRFMRRKRNAPAWYVCIICIPPPCIIPFLIFTKIITY